MYREIDTLNDHDISALSAWMFLELIFSCQGGPVACFPTCSLSMRTTDGDDDAAGDHAGDPLGCSVHSLPLETPLLTNPMSVTFLY